METLNILPGYLCNLKCTHCLNDSGPHRQNSGLTEAEFLQISDDINEYSPKKIMFTGGEPSLYIDSINRILGFHPNINNCEVTITTNGRFAINIENALVVLKKIKKLNRLQMSFDLFHHNTSDKFNIEYLHTACNRLGIPMVLTMAISEPAQLILATKYTEYFGVNVIFQKVGKAGRAKRNGIDFKFFTFEPEVLKKKCPNNGAIAYIAGKGYSSCCSGLVFDNQIDGICHKSIQQHLKSKFRLNTQNMTMEDLANEKGVNTTIPLAPELSSVCALCEYIHLKGKPYGKDQ